MHHHFCTAPLLEPGLTARGNTGTNVVRGASQGIDMDAHEPSLADIAPVGARSCTPLDMPDQEL